MLTFDNLTFRYPKAKADTIVEASASIGAGIHLLMGENGAGKTTLFHLAAGLLISRQGTCMIDGVNTATRLPSVREKMFFLPDNLICPFSTIYDMARYHAPFYPKFDPGMLDVNLRDFNLNGKERIKAMSLGQRHKSFLAYALALGTDILMLDEPANGLDIESKKTLRHMISRCITDEQTLIISTHTVSDLLTLYDSVIIMRHGKIMLSASLEDITSRLSFVCAPSPISGALYQEPESGLFKAILPHESDGETTDVDFNLLYSALASDASEEILQKFKTTATHEITDR